MTPRPPRNAPGPGLAQRILAKLFRFLRRRLDQVSQGRLDSAVLVTVGVVWLLTSLLFAIAAAVDLVRDREDWLVLLVVGGLVGTAGFTSARMAHFPTRLTVQRLFGAVVGGTFAAVAAIMVAHLATGTTSALDVAFVESAATVTGTNASVLDPSMMSEGILMLRAAGQWAGGAALIVIVVRVLPHLGVGGLDADGGVATRSARRLSPRTGATMGRLLLLYSGLTGLMAIAYVVVGMPFIDSGIHAMTTISTGGFSTRAGSIGAYDSAAIEWVAIGGMLAGGTSLPLMFLAVRRRDPRRFARSLEFRIYVVFIAFVAFSIVAWSDAAPTTQSVREALFAATSAISTTGYLASDISLFPDGGTVLLVVLTVIGGMSASVAGGFKVVRFLAIASYITRELRRAIHPSATETVHLGRSSIGEVALSRIVGELLAAMLLLVPAVVLLAAAGLDVEGAFSFAASSLSNVGPAFGAAGPDGHLQVMNGLGHATSGALMVVGRIGVLPVVVSVLVRTEPLARSIRVRSHRVPDQVTR